MLDAETPEPGGRGGVPHGTTPTWEMELLLSGATVFGLVALPAQLDRLFFPLMNGTGSDTIVRLLLAGWLYAKFSAWSLVVTFVLHLALRGYWIALVGLDSVYPGGIRWERLRMGPLHRAVVQSRVPAMAVRIETADNRATRVFGVGVAMALAMLAPFAIVTIATAVSLVLGWVGVEVPGHGVIGAFLLVFLPLFLAMVVDRRVGARLAPNGLAARAVGGVLRAYDRVGLGRGMNAPMALFRSNVGGARATAVLVASAMAGTALLMGQVAMKAGWDPGSYPGLPGDEDAAAGDVVDPDHYATARSTEPTFAPKPFVSERVVKGPYLELFVPYRPTRHGPVLARACPDAVAVAERGGPARASLDCLAAILDVRIDGEARAIRLDGSSDPATGQRGVVALLRVDELAAGRHELSLRRVPRPGRPDDAGRERIAFWR